MSKDYPAISDAQDKRAAELFRAAPDIMRGHRTVTQAAQTPKALDVKTTELMALAVAIVQRCEGCVVFHTKQALSHGATREELCDAIAVAIEMGGGPATVYGADALAAYDSFSG
ncbi:MAG: carboxymuconolactone decarboxylase family protein [Alphaproteobacteria bacterium]|jgi:AhpD family alkylhydroperoxidase|nr:carboxymuconolactone decarboxylase family protein [Alphaproteobacteria bacterium]